MKSQKKSVSQSGILKKTAASDRNVPHRPSLTPHINAHQIGADQILLVSETFNTLLHGQLLCDLLPLLDGHRTIEELETELTGSYTAEAIEQTISSLSSKGYVVSGDHEMGRDRAAYWSSLGVSPCWAEESLSEWRVSLHGDDGTLEERLGESGVSISKDNPDLYVLVQDDYLDQRLDAINRSHLTQKTPWIVVCPFGIQPLFGPVFRSDGDGPCWKCLSYRMRNHQEVHAFLRNFAGEDAAFRPFATEPSVRQGLSGLIAAEIAKWLVVQELSTLHEHAISINLATLENSRHFVERRPQCTVCGLEELYNPDRSPSPIELKSSPKNHFNSGGDRSVAPQVTLAKYRHLVSPISGVVSWLERTSKDTDSWLHVHWSGSNLAMGHRTLNALRRSLRSKSAGKGSTREQSEVSALCEAVERYSGAYHGDEIQIQKCFTDFEEDKVIHPNDVQLFSNHQIDNADEINAKGHPYNVVPSRFETNAPTAWTPIWSLTRKKHVYLPTSMLYSMSAEQRSVSDLVADSNGCAAGNTLEEAILQGFYELVERDAFAIWWYNRLRVPAVDISSLDDEYLASARDYYAEYDRELWLLDITSDIDIPVFVAASRRLNNTTEDIIYGAGAHSSSKIAALRAICELNQCLSWLPGPDKTAGKPSIDDPLALWWWKTARLEDCPWLVPDNSVPMSNLSSSLVPDSTDARDDVDYCVSTVQDRGMEFLVLDQTRPDVGMPVVRVIVPGMRHFWARFAPGRLYDVPVGLGRRTHALDENDLNPIPVIV